MLVGVLKDALQPGEGGVVEDAELALELEPLLLIGNVAALGQCWRSCSRNTGPVCQWEASWIAQMRTSGWVALFTG